MFGSRRKSISETELSYIGGIRPRSITETIVGTVVSDGEIVEGIKNYVFNGPNATIKQYMRFARERHVDGLLQGRVLVAGEANKMLHQHLAENFGEYVLVQEYVPAVTDTDWGGQTVIITPAIPEKWEYVLDVDYLGVDEQDPIHFAFSHLQKNNEYDFESNTFYIFQEIESEEENGEPEIVANGPFELVSLQVFLNEGMLNIADIADIFTVFNDKILEESEIQILPLGETKSPSFIQINFKTAGGSGTTLFNMQLPLDIGTAEHVYGSDREDIVGYVENDRQDIENEEENTNFPILSFPAATVDVEHIEKEVLIENPDSYFVLPFEDTLLILLQKENTLKIRKINSDWDIVEEKTLITSGALSFYEISASISPRGNWILIDFKEQHSKSIQKHLALRVQDLNNTNIESPIPIDTLSLLPESLIENGDIVQQVCFENYNEDSDPKYSISVRVQKNNSWVRFFGLITKNSLNVFNLSKSLTIVENEKLVDVIGNKFPYLFIALVKTEYDIKIEQHILDFEEFPQDHIQVTGPEDLFYSVLSFTESLKQNVGNFSDEFLALNEIGDEYQTAQVLDLPILFKNGIFTLIPIKVKEVDFYLLIDSLKGEVGIPFLKEHITLGENEERSIVYGEINEDEDSLFLVSNDKTISVIPSSVDDIVEKETVSFSELENEELSNIFTLKNQIYAFSGKKTEIEMSVPVIDENGEEEETEDVVVEIPSRLFVFTFNSYNSNRDINEDTIDWDNFDESRYDFRDTEHRIYAQASFLLDGKRVFFYEDINDGTNALGFLRAYNDVIPDGIPSTPIVNIKNNGNWADSKSSRRYQDNARILNILGLSYKNVLRDLKRQKHSDRLAQINFVIASRFKRPIDTMDGFPDSTTEMFGRQFITRDLFKTRTRPVSGKQKKIWEPRPRKFGITDRAIKHQAGIDVDLSGFSVNNYFQALLGDPDAAHNRAFATGPAANYWFNWFNNYSIPFREFFENNEVIGVVRVGGLFEQTGLAIERSLPIFRWAHRSYEIVLGASGYSNEIIETNTSSHRKVRMRVRKRKISRTYNTMDGRGNPVTRTHTYKLSDVILEKVIDEGHLHRITVKGVQSTQFISPRAAEFTLGRGKRYITRRCDHSKFALPIEMSIFEGLTPPEQVYMFYGGTVLQISIFARIKVKNGFLAFISIVVAMVLTVLSLGSAVGTLAAAGSFAAAMSAMAQMIVIAIIVGEIAKALVKVLGPKFAFLVSLVALIVSYGAAGGMGLGLSMPGAETFLQFSMGLMANMSTAINAHTEEMLGAAEKELKALEKKMDALMDLAEELGLTKESHYLMPFLIPGERPDEFFNRTVGNTNPGLAAIDQVQYYVDMMTQLPDSRAEFLKELYDETKPIFH